MAGRALGVGLTVLVASAGAAWSQSSVPFYHNTTDHAGVFTTPGVTGQTVAGTTQDTGFDGSVTGVINAAPLYWRQPGAAHGWVIVATDSNAVTALDEVTGKPVWSTTLGATASRAGECGNIAPIGVTGTPVIDTATGTLYADAVIGAGSSETHELFALSLADGSVLPGWPVAIGAGVVKLGQAFTDNIEEQRGALALVKGQVFIPFGGYDGDCGAYHGIVAAVSTTRPGVVNAWSTRDQKGGIWAPGGIVSDGSSLWAATGNTASATTWGGGEAIVHLTPGQSHVTSPNDYFSPANWHTLDDEDQDLGGTNVSLIDLAGANPPHLALGLGKDGNAYLVNRLALGGIGPALQTVKVSDSAIRSATAVYKNGSVAMVVVNAHSAAANCSSTYNGVEAFSIAAAPAPKLTVAWCAPLSGGGAPIVTTTDGVANPIVWITGAEHDEELHAYDGLTGQPLYTSPALPNVIAHFSTLMVANSRLYVPAQNKVFAFALGGAE